MGTEPYIGEIQLFGGNFAPRGWAFCDGTLLAIASNDALFAIISTRFGGDGRTTFALPDLRGRLAAGAGQGPGLTRRVAGARLGREQVVLNTNTLATHTHTATSTIQAQVAASTTQGSISNPTDGSKLGAGYDVQLAQPLQIYANGSPPTVQLGGTDASASVTLATAGSGLGHDNMMPWLAVNYIIALTGIFPQRN